LGGQGYRGTCQETRPPGGYLKVRFYNGASVEHGLVYTCDMKIEFSLTFEDYVEWQSPNVPRKQSNVGIILALAGFLSLGLGYTILRSSPERNNFFPGGFFLLGGLLATVAAIPVGLLVARRRPEKTRADLRSEFERFHVDRRSVEADETGWAFTYGTAVNKRRWTDLAYMREAQRTLVLSDTFAWYVLPKSVFSMEHLQEFKGLCGRALIPEKLWSVSMISRKADYVRAMVAHNWYKARWAVVGLYALGFVCALFVGLIIADRLFVLGVFAITLLALLLYSAQQWYYSQKFEQQYIWHSFQSATVLKDAICFRTASGLSVITGSEIKKIRYRWISDVRETKRSFMLYVSPKVFYLLPKAEFTPDQLAQFRELLRTRSQEQAPVS
jgi:YcxB-like protein